MIQRIKPRILKSDKLGRDVLSRSDRRKIQKRRTPAALFMDDTSKTEISVNRLTPEPGQKAPADRPDLVSDEIIATISHRRAKTLGRNFYGWAELLVKHAERKGRTVLATPQDDNDSHADILLPAEAKASREEREEHAEDLAKRTTWCPRPQME